VARHDHVRPDQPAAARDQAPEQGLERGERGIGHHRERAAGEPEVGGVRPDDPHRVPGEALAQPGGPPAVQLHGDDLGAGRDEERGERTETGADVEDQVTGRHLGRVDQAPRRGVIELVPSPAWSRIRDHDAPS
jgi:hypothetical protein